jgi:uncharacterized membrane protein
MTWFTVVGRNRGRVSKSTSARGAIRALLTRAATQPLRKPLTCLGNAALLGCGTGQEPTPLEQRIVLAPNCSLTPKGAALFFASLCAVSLLFALFFAVQGLWPVLPFWGLEMFVLGLALHLSLRRRHERQVLTITDDSISIVWVSRDREEKQEFSRHWARVKLRSPRTNLYPSRLLVESHGRAFEVGSFLTEEERRSLAMRLATMVGRVDESPSLN